MALSGGRDGKIILWDLMRGRQAFVYRIPSPRKGMKPTINHIVWSEDGDDEMKSRKRKITEVPLHGGRGEWDETCFDGD